jgi:hypothetical protein
VFVDAVAGEFARNEVSCHLFFTARGPLFLSRFC